MAQLPPLKSPSLEEVLRYENADLLERFHKVLSYPADVGAEIFVELKKWLWICNELRVERSKGVQGIPEHMSLHAEIQIIDEMWHEFVLFTREYRAFCETYFGQFVQHVPTTEAMKRKELEELPKDPEARHRFLKERLTAHYGFVHDKLGKETLERWYVQYPERFSPARISEARIEALRSSLQGHDHAGADPKGRRRPAA